MHRIKALVITIENHTASWMRIFLMLANKSCKLHQPIGVKTLLKR